jgi:oxygen-dependent protoporphyrinogen oxidase
MTISRLFFSPLWSHAGKFRLLMEPFISRTVQGKVATNESVSEFVTRRFGKEFLEKAMEPFIAGTLASDPDLACARHVIPRLTALENKFGSISAGIFMHKIMGKRTARNPEAFSFEGGLQTLTKMIASKPQVGFKGDTHVNNIIRHQDYDWEVEAQNSQGEVSCRARHVVISSPAESASQLIKPIDNTLSELLKSIEYAPLSVVHIGLQRSAITHRLDSVGFLVPRMEKKNFNLRINGNLWMSSVFANRAPKNNILLSSYLGGCRDPSAINLSEQQSIDQVLSDIRPLLGLSLKSGASPLMGKVNKHQQAIPLYHGNYHNKLLAIDDQLQTLQGLHLQANYKGGVSIRDRIVQAKKMATIITAQLASKNKSIYLDRNFVAHSLAQQI